MDSCLYLYQIAQELKNLEPNFFLDYLLPIVPILMSIYLIKQNRDLQTQLITSTKLENLQQEFLRFNEQIYAVYWELDKIYSGLPRIAASKELQLTKEELSDQISALIKIAGRFAFLSRRDTTLEKTREISREVQKLCASIEDFLDSEDMELINTTHNYREDKIAHLEMDICKKESPISTLKCQSMRTLCDFHDYLKYMGSIGEELSHTSNNKSFQPNIPTSTNSTNTSK